MLIFSCSSENNLENRKQQILKGDAGNLPKSMSLVDGQSLDLNAVKADLYSEGCQTIGAPQPVLKLHPQLKPKTVYLVNNTKVQGSNRFNLSYFLTFKQMPTEQSDIILSGEVTEAKLSGFTGEIFNLNNLNVEKKCSVVASGQPTEKCDDVDVDYTNEFINAYNKVFKEDTGCEYGATDKPLKEKWLEGRYELDSGKKIKVYIHSVQTSWNRICAGEKQPRRVFKTIFKATSNHIVSSRRAHCGGELVFEREILRDEASNEILSYQEYRLSLAPAATVGD